MSNIPSKGLGLHLIWMQSSIASFDGTLIMNHALFLTRIKLNQDHIFLALKIKLKTKLKTWQRTVIHNNIWLDTKPINYV